MEHGVAQFMVYPPYIKTSTFTVHLIRTKNRRSLKGDVLYAMHRYIHIVPVHCIPPFELFVAGLRCDRLQLVCIGWPLLIKTISFVTKSVFEIYDRGGRVGSSAGAVPGKSD